METVDAVAELKELVRERVEAVAGRRADVLLERQHRDVLSYPLLPPTVQRGRDGTAEAISRWFDGYSDGPGYEVRDLHVDADGDLGYCAFFYHVTGTLGSGDEVDMWVRATLVCRHVEDEWKIVHDHESVPFDAATGRALISEAPDA